MSDNNSDDLSCPICLENLDINKNYSVSECGHQFHTSCLFKSMLNDIKCPICRQSLLEESEPEDTLTEYVVDSEPEDTFTECNCVEDGETGYCRICDQPCRSYYDNL